MSGKGKRQNNPTALEDFLERQDYTHNPGKFVGNYRYRTPVMVLADSPIALLLLILFGAIIGVAAFVIMLMDFDWSNMLRAAPALALSIFLVVGGIRKLRHKKKIHRN